MKIIVILCFIGYQIGLTFSLPQENSDSAAYESRISSRYSSMLSANSLDGSSNTPDKLSNALTSSSLTKTSQSQTSQSISQPQSTIYQHMQTGQRTPDLPTTGFMIAVNTQGNGNRPTIYSAGATPVIMQYLPESQSSNGIQFLQLIPTRPLIVPISPYIANLPATGQSNGVSQDSTISNSQGLSKYGTHNNVASSQTSKERSIPIPLSYSAYGTSQTFNSNQVEQGASYSNQVLSVFRPNGGIQLVSGPQDLSLNTNEFMPRTNGIANYKTV